MAVIDTGSSTSGKANVDANFGLVVNNVTTATAAGFVTAEYERDAGSVTGARLMGQPQTSINRRQIVGLDTLLFSDAFNAANQNTGIWRSGVTTFTLGTTGGYITFNNGSSTSTGAAQIYSTYKAFPLFGAGTLVCDIGTLIGAAPPSNWQADIGLFYSGTFASTWTPTDGVYFRINSTGLFGVVNAAGTETLTGTLVAAGSIPVNSNFVLRTVVGDDWCEFWWTDSNGNFVYLGKLATPAGQGLPLFAPSAPVSFRLSHPGVAGAAVQIKFSHANVYLGDVASNKPWSHQMAGMGLMAYQGQNGAGLGTSALYTNSLNQGAGAAATNTTAALGSGLGGQFSVQPTLAQGTDGIISSYQNPPNLSAATQTMRTLYITGVSVQGLVTTAFTGGPVLYAYSLAFGHTAVSLATAEAVAGKAARRIALGYETYVVTAAVGALGQGVTRTFQSPIVVNPGEFIQLVAKNLGTVTSAGVIALLVTFDGYFE